MKLLFDENLSRRLVARLASEFPDSAHVVEVGLTSARDEDVWHHAAANDFTIVTKDTDFQQRALLDGPPPKIVWLRVGNCSTDGIVELLRFHADKIEAFGADPEASFLVLS